MKELIDFIGINGLKGMGAVMSFATINYISNKFYAYSDSKVFKFTIAGLGIITLGLLVNLVHEFYKWMNKLGLS